MNFELISVESMSDRLRPREEAKKRIREYREKRSASDIERPSEPPPVGSLRRVFHAASTGAKSSVWERIKRRLRRFIGDDCFRF